MSFWQELILRVTVAVMDLFDEHFPEAFDSDEEEGTEESEEYD